MTLQEQIEDQKRRTIAGYPAATLLSDIGLPGRSSERAADRSFATPPPFLPAPLPDPVKRACDSCGKAAPYVPVRLRANGPDVFAGHRFVCDACNEAALEMEAATARQSLAAKRQATWEKVIPEKYRITDIHHPEFNLPVWNILRSIDPATRAVALIGPAGRCKSRMLALFAKRLIAADTFVAWTNANRFQWAAQREFDDREGPEARQLLRRWTEAKVLILDDLGKQRWTDTVEAAFFSLIEARSAGLRITHWSMNPNPMDAIGPAQLELHGPDIVARGLDSTGQASARARFSPILSRLIDGTLLIPVP